MLKSERKGSIGNVSHTALWFPLTCYPHKVEGNNKSLKTNAQNFSQQQLKNKLKLKIKAPPWRTHKMMVFECNFYITQTLWDCLHQYSINCERMDELMNWWEFDSFLWSLNIGLMFT